jgi:hypothetical protein
LKTPTAGIKRGGVRRIVYRRSGKKEIILKLILKTNKTGNILFSTYSLDEILKQLEAVRARGA